MCELQMLSKGYLQLLVQTDSGNISRASEMSVYAEEMKKYSKFLIFLSFACELGEFRQLSYVRGLTDQKETKTVLPAAKRNSKSGDIVLSAASTAEAISW